MRPTNPTGSSGPTLKILLDSVADPICFSVLERLASKEKLSIDNIQLRNGGSSDTLQELKQDRLSALENAGYIVVEDSVLSKGPRFDDLKPYLKNWSIDTP